MAMAADDGDAAAAARAATPAQRRALRRLHEAMEAFEAQLQCPICLCAYATPASLPCNHCFCEECIHRALELKQVCPICKAPAKKRQLRHDTMIQQLQQAAEIWGSVAPAIDLNEPDTPPPRATGSGAKESNGLYGSGSNTGDSEATAISVEMTPVRINPRITAESATRRRKRASPERRQAEVSTTTSQPMIVSPLAAIPAAATTTTAVASKSKAATVVLERPVQTRVNEEKEIEGKSPLLVQPPTKKRAVANGVTHVQANEVNTSESSRHHLSNGHHDTNGIGENGANPNEPTEVTAFQVGQLVEVIDRTWRGINKPGGAAWITEVYNDHTYDVRYIIGTRRESHVPDQYILTPSEQIVSLATPSRAVKQHRRKQPVKLQTPPSVDLLGGSFVAMNGHHERPDSVFLCSGFDDEGNAEIRMWADAIGAQVVDQWSPYVTHLIAKCATPKEVAASLAEDDGHGGEGRSSSSSQNGSNRKRSLFKDEPHKRWVKIRSMKYLKALVAGRWIVSEEWLRDCVKQGKRLSEAAYEAEGHLRAQNVIAACKRSRAMREEILRYLPLEENPTSIGSRLFADCCFHIYGEFLSPMPPPVELDTLISIGGGKVIRFIDDIEREMDKAENRSRALVIVCDKLNHMMLRRTAKELTALPQLQSVSDKHVVSYQWVLNSISEAKLRAFS